MKKILYSLNPQEYPDLEIDFVETTAKDARNYTTGQVVEAKKQLKFRLSN